MTMQNLSLAANFLIRLQELASLLTYSLLSIQINIFYIQLYFSQDCAVSNLLELPGPHRPLKQYYANRCRRRGTVLIRC
jgi:hypothetical protein